MKYAIPPLPRDCIYVAKHLITKVTFPGFYESINRNKPGNS